MSVRPLVRWLSSVLLHFSLFFFIGAVVFVSVLSNKQVLKDSLVSSQVYESFVTTVIDSNLDESTQTLSSLPLSDQKVRTIIIDSFSPQILKKQTDEVIDNGYKWLNGESSSLVFQYDFSGSKAVMNNALSNYAAERVMSLPVCEEIPMEVNVFTIECRPVNINFEFIRAQTLADLDSSELLKDPVVNQDDLPESADGQSLEDKYAFIPQIYQFMKLALPISVGLFILSAVFFVFARSPLQKGLRALGKDMLSNGIMLIILTVIFGYVVPRYTNSYGISGNQLSGLMSKASDTYIHRIDIVVINVAIQVAAVGLGLLLILRINSSTGMYAAVKRKSGVETSVGKTESAQKRSARPPLQTSEEVTKTKKRKTTTTAKRYKGAKW